MKDLAGDMNTQTDLSDDWMSIIMDACDSTCPVEMPLASKPMHGHNHHHSQQVYAMEIHHLSGSSAFGSQASKMHSQQHPHMSGMHGRESTDNPADFLAMKLDPFDSLLMGNRPEEEPLVHSHGGQSSKCDSDPGGEECIELQEAAPRRRAKRSRSRTFDDGGSDNEGYNMQGGPVSHSTVEKQRRDRLNLLIDDLAEQVPPSNSKYKGAIRRPKHVVLSDTLMLLTLLKDRLKDCEMVAHKSAAAAQVDEGPGIQVAGSAAKGQPHTAGAEGRSSRGRTRSSRGATAPELPAGQSVVPKPVTGTCSPAPMRELSAAQKPVLQGLCQLGSPVRVEDGPNGLWRIHVTGMNCKSLLPEVFSALLPMSLTVMDAQMVTAANQELSCRIDARAERPGIQKREVQENLEAALFSILACAAEPDSVTLIHNTMPNSPTSWSA